MKIGIRSSDPTSETRALTWPILEAGNSSFPNGEYMVEIEHQKTGESFNLTHNVDGADLINRWIDIGLVKFVCSVAAPISAYRILHVSSSPKQLVSWDANEIGSHPLFTPMIVSGSDIQHVIDAGSDGANPLWDGKVVHLLKGSRLAICSTFALKSGMLGLLDFQLKEDYELGTFSVEPSREEGFKFKVYLASNLFSHLKFQRTSSIGANIMTHVVSAALNHLKNEFRGDDGEEGWESFVNLRALAEILENKKLGHWEDLDFDPELVATKLYPHQVPMESD